MSLQAAATNNAALVTTNAATPYAIAERGPNHRVWKSVVTSTNLNGKVISRTNSFTELATGMHHWQQGAWADADETIQLAADGSAAYATNSQHQVGFAANLHVTGAIDLVMPDGQHLNSTVLGLRYEEVTTGSNVVLATLQDSIGQLLPSLNQVLYTNALADTETSFHAEVLYTHKRNRFEQDIILRQQPPGPEQFGLNPTNTRLQVWTEFFNPPDPTISTNLRPVKAGQTLADEKLDFGSMRMGRGNAFASGGATNATSIAANGMMLTPVAKHWVHLQGRTFLVEEVPYNAVAAQLGALPPATSSNAAPANSAGSQSLFRSPPAKEKLAHLKQPPMRLAQVDLKKQPGFLLDYDLIDTSVTNFTFQSDTTYYVSGTVNLYGTTTVEGGTVLKLDVPNGMTVMEDDVRWLTGPYRPAIFTCTNDDSVGLAPWRGRRLIKNLRLILGFFLSL